MQKQGWICSFDIFLRCWPQREYVWGASQSLFWTTPKQRIKKQQQNNTSFLHNTRVKTSHSFGLHWHMQIGRRLDFFKTSSASSCCFHHTTFLLHMSSNSGSTSIVFSVFANPVWCAPSASVRSPRPCKRTTTPDNTYLILLANLRQYFTMTRKKDNMENVRKRIGYNSTMQLRFTTTT